MVYAKALATLNFASAALRLLIGFGDGVAMIHAQHAATNMRFQSSLPAAFIGMVLTHSARNVRANPANNDHNRNLKKTADRNPRALRPLNDCTINAIAFLQIPGEPPIPGGDEQYGCDDGSDSFYPLNLDRSQARSMKNQAAEGTLTFGVSMIDVQGATVGNDDSVTLPPGHDIKVLEQDGGNTFKRGRELQAGTGNKHFLLFRVTDVNGLVYGHNAATMSDNLFGTGTDTINLKSQMTACSVGKYTIIPGGKGTYDTTPLETGPGVIDITIDISISLVDSKRNDVKNAAFAAAKEKLGTHFGLSTSTSLTTYMDHALFSLENCYGLECGWAGYAGVGSYYQFYQGAYYGYAGVLLHEHGHNMGFAHSGGLDGLTYTDHTCSMGNPLYGDDDGRMCFNPAKNWQMLVNPHPVTVFSSWYDSADFVTVDTAQGPQTVKMIGVGEYNLQGDGVSIPRKAIAIKVENGSTRPQYVAFNSAKGANAQNVEADNQVTILEYTGTGYGESSLKGYVTQGNSFTTAESRIVTATCINTAVTPSLACVCVRDASQSCPSDCQCTDSPPNDWCTANVGLFDSAKFSELAAPPDPGPYTYVNFCDAVDEWNNANPSNQIFVQGTETDQLHELAAFFGHALTNSNEFTATRDFEECNINKDVGVASVKWCKPVGSNLAANQEYTDPFCDQDSTSDCTCPTVTADIDGFVPANSLFFGRGAFQLSYNYNYDSFNNAMFGPDFCTYPDRVASGTAAWTSAIHFWMTNQIGGSRTCHSSVLGDKDFGGTLDIINGGECPAEGNNANKVKARMNQYCKASKVMGLDSILGLEGCANLAEERFLECLMDGSCPECNDLEYGSCSINPDPHYVIWENNWYDYHGGCDHYAMTNSKLQIQIRTRPLKPESASGFKWSTTTQIAVKIMDTGEVFRIRHNAGSENSIAGAGIAHYSFSGGAHKIEFGSPPTGSSFIRIRDSASGGLHMQILGSGKFFGGSEGMCGSWNDGGLRNRKLSGQAMGDLIDLSGDYDEKRVKSTAAAESWKIPLTESELWEPSDICDHSPVCGGGNAFPCGSTRRHLTHVQPPPCDRTCDDVSIPVFREQCEFDNDRTGLNWACEPNYLDPVMVPRYSRLFNTPPPTPAPTPAPTFGPGSGSGCYKAYSSGGVYTDGNKFASYPVQVTTGGNTVTKTYNFECTEFARCGQAGYEPVNIYGTAAWKKLSECSGTVTPPVVPQPTAWSGSGCPKAYSAADYESGDVVSVTTPYAWGDVYSCNTAPSNLWCGMAGYEPGVGLYWAQAWTAQGSCTGTMSPTGSPVYVVLPSVGGCPAAFDGGADYEEGDTVSMGNFVYKCKRWPLSQHCSQAGYEPGTDVGGVEHWKEAWDVAGHCSGTIQPTSSPNFVSLQDMGGCADKWSLKTMSDPTLYEEGDLVSSNGLVFACKAWPYSNHCGQAGYEPLINPATPEAWRDAWTLKGYCNGSIGPTSSPNHNPALSVGACPDAWSSGIHTKYEEGDMVSVTVSTTPLRKVVFKCKAWPYSGHCAQYAPDASNGSLGWNLKGSCNGSNAPTGSPVQYMGNLAAPFGCQYQSCKDVETACTCSLSNCPSTPGQTTGCKVTTNVCVMKNVDLYSKTASYNAGDEVRVGVQRYKCRGWPNSGWCGNEGYQPEVTAVWGDAWTKSGICM